MARNSSCEFARRWRRQGSSLPLTPAQAGIQAKNRVPACLSPTRSGTGTSGNAISLVWTGRNRASITRALRLKPAVSAGFGAQVAQLVEHVTENHGVGGSIP